MSSDKVIVKRQAHTKCFAKDCNHRKNTHNCIFSVFPTNQDRCKKWLKAVGEKDFVGLPISKLSTVRFICSCHFNPEDYKLTKCGKRLNRDAVPSIFSENTLSLTDSEVNEFSTERSASLVPSNTLKLSMQEIKQSTQYSFHKMFDQLINEQLKGQSEKLNKAVVASPKLLLYNDEDKFRESSAAKEGLIVSRKRTFSCMELETEKSASTSKPPSQKKNCQIDKSTSLSLTHFNDDQSTEVSIVDKSSTVPSTPKKISHVRHSELVGKAHAERWHAEKKIITLKEQLKDSMDEGTVIVNELYTSFMKKLKKCICKLQKSAATEVFSKLHEIVDIYNIKN